MKKKLMILAAVFVGIVFYFSHSTYWKYNDWWIVGNDIDSVEKNMENLILI